MSKPPSTQSCRDAIAIALCIATIALPHPAAADEVDDASVPVVATPSTGERPPDEPQSNIRWPAGARGPAPVAPVVSAPATPDMSTAETPPIAPPANNFRWPGASAAPPVPVAADAPPSNIHAPQATMPTADAAAVPNDVSAQGEATKPATPADLFQQGLAAWRRTADPQRHVDARRLFQAAADAGDLRASAALGYLQGLGLGGPRDVAAARRRLQAASAAGLAHADYLLSLIEADARDPSRELSLRESAARRGDAAAQNAMGVTYQRMGDRTTAEMWFRRAADSGSPSARLNLASLAHEDDARAAARATQASADSGDADALFALARRYHRGDGVPADYGKALRYYRAAAAKGHAASRRMLGLIQSRTATGGGIDPAWMRQLASVDIDADVRTRPAPAAAAPPRLDDPLAGLAARAAH